jgi:hypothetical protein
MIDKTISPLRQRMTSPTIGRFFKNAAPTPNILT